MKVVFAILFILYICMGLLSGFGYMYFEVESQRMADGQIGKSLFLITSVVGIGAYVFFYLTCKDWISEQTRATKVILFFLTIMICAFVNYSLVIKFNAWFGDNEPYPIEGRVADKWINKKGKGPPKFYLVVENPETGRRFTFRVRRRVYDMFAPGMYFEKEFRVGYYGIIYRKDP